MDHIENKKFENKDFTQLAFPIAEYELCQFVNCNFSAADLSNIKFVECEFVRSHLSNAKLVNTALQKVKFHYCKMLGLRFEDCNDFLLDLEFDNCLLHYASFYKKKITNTPFTNCQLHEVDFTEANLDKSDFAYSDLTRAIFANSNLESVNFETAFNYSIDPENNRIRKAQFSSEGLPGLLDKYYIKVI